MGTIRLFAPQSTTLCQITLELTALLTFSREVPDSANRMALGNSRRLRLHNLTELAMKLSKDCPCRPNLASTDIDGMIYAVRYADLERR
jgi:hypothetical protein